MTPTTPVTWSPAIVGASISDVDNGALEGVAVTAVDNSNGTWQFSTDNGSTWADVGTVTDNSALLLRAVDQLRFVPDAMNADAATITYRAWDQTSGTQGTKVDTQRPTAARPPSAPPPTPPALRSPHVNDAPVLDNSGTPTLTTITEDDTNNAGDLVSAIVGASISDVDTGASKASPLRSWTTATARGSTLPTTAQPGLTLAPCPTTRPCC